MDRLTAASAWNEPQSLEQALLVAQHQYEKIDWAELGRWVDNEQIVGDKEIVDFYRQIGRPLPK